MRWRISLHVGYGCEEQYAVGKVGESRVRGIEEKEKWNTDSVVAIVDLLL